MEATANVTFKCRFEVISDHSSLFHEHPGALNGNVLVHIGESGRDFGKFWLTCSLYWYVLGFHLLGLVKVRKYMMPASHYCNTTSLQLRKKRQDEEELGHYKLAPCTHWVILVIMCPYNHFGIYCSV